VKGEERGKGRKEGGGERSDLARSATRAKKKKEKKEGKGKRRKEKKKTPRHGHPLFDR